MPLGWTCSPQPYCAPSAPTNHFQRALALIDLRLFSSRMGMTNLCSILRSFPKTKNGWPPSPKNDAATGAWLDDDWAVAMDSVSSDDQQSWWPQ